MKIGSRQRLLFIGDSITDCGRAQPVGTGNGLGGGYVSLVNSLITTVYPERRILVLNTGTSGNTVLDLKARWKRDVLDLKPDWLSIMIGINDVWRQFDCALEPDNHVQPDVYEKTLRALVDATRVKGLVLVSPYYIEDNRSDDMRKRMDQYGAIVAKIAKQEGAIFVDTQAAFNAVLKHLPSELFAWDRVHPGAAGHMILARVFLDAIGFEWSRS
jgi:lysophospholipase L1-like esterase